MRLLQLAAASALLLFPLLGRASTIYTYTGQDYTSATLPYNTSESVTGSFTLNTALGANLSNSSIAPVSFSFSDGNQTLTDQTALNYSFSNISTDANGNLTGYSIQINNTTLGLIKLVDVGGGLNGDTVRLASALGASNQTAGSFALAGAVASTPEPASLLLLGTGLLGLVALRRFRTAEVEAVGARQ